MDDAEGWKRKTNLSSSQINIFETAKQDLTIETKLFFDKISTREESMNSIFQSRIRLREIIYHRPVNPFSMTDQPVDPSRSKPSSK